MKRRGEISPSLWFFQNASLMAKSLEENKFKTRNAKTAPARARALKVCEDCERTLDKAWDLIGVIAEESGDEIAEIVAAHFLFCEDWYEVSTRTGYSRDRCKRWAYKAIKRLDDDGR